MEFTLQKQNRNFFYCVLFITVLILLGSSVPVIALSSIGNLNPNCDTAFGNLLLDVGGDNGSPEYIPGWYFGGQIFLESPLIKRVFETERFYTLYDLGMTFIHGPDLIYVTLVSLDLELSFRIEILKRLSLYPYAGYGLNIIPIDYSFISSQGFLTFNAGIMIRYRLWEDTYLKLRIEFGALFSGTFEKGYTNYLRVIWPVPFIP